MTKGALPTSARGYARAPYAVRLCHMTRHCEWVQRGGLRQRMSGEGREGRPEQKGASRLGEMG